MARVREVDLDREVRETDRVADGREVLLRGSEGSRGSWMEGGLGLKYLMMTMSRICLDSVTYVNK